jgi:adenylate kinase
MMRYTTVLLFGPPGSGKGTQGKLLGERSGIVHFACGDVFRALDRDSDMGRLFASYANSGSLVPDELTVELWRVTLQARIASSQYDPVRDVLVLDGIPRTVDQARLLGPHIDVRAVIDLYVNDVAQIIARLHKRALTQDRKDDTSEEIIRHRLEVYEEQTRPVLDFYPRSRVFRVNATQELPKVTADILRALPFLQP